MKRITVLAVATLIAGCGEQTTEHAAETAAETPPLVEEATPITPPRSLSAEGARVFFIAPADGDTVTNPVAIEFGIEGMTVAPAGDNMPHAGHHHLLIDTGLPDLRFPIPADEQHVHFGDASTATEITLAPGDHTLQMLLGDHLHIPHDPPLASDVITITVETAE